MKEWRKTGIFPQNHFDDLFEMFNEFKGVIVDTEKYMLKPEYEVKALEEEIKNLNKQKDWLLRECTLLDISLQEAEKRLKDLQESK